MGTISMKPTIFFQCTKIKLLPHMDTVNKCNNLTCTNEQDAEMISKNSNECAEAQLITASAQIDIIVEYRMAITLLLSHHYPILPNSK
jgi:hypothetical protein